MRNPLPKTTQIRTIGEVFVQLKLLEFDVQAAPPMRDSGNDLVAIKGRIIKLIQVKTTQNDDWNLNNLKKVYDLVFLVKLESEDNRILFDKSKVFVLQEGEPKSSKVELTKEIVDDLWQK